MDDIQKVLVKAGRKDLAQKYYEKVSATADPYEITPDIVSAIKQTVNGIKNKVLKRKTVVKQPNSVKILFRLSDGHKFDDYTYVLSFDEWARAFLLTDTANNLWEGEKLDKKEITDAIKENINQAIGWFKPGEPA